MIRQARTYLFGAVSATSLIAAAVVAFVALVSLQALRDWPLAGLAGGDSGTAAVSAGHPVKHGPTVGVGAGKAATPEKAPAEISRRGKIRQSSTGAISPSNGAPQAKSPTATPQTQSTGAGGSQPNPSGSSGGSASSGGGSGGATKPSGAGGGGGSGGGGEPGSTGGGPSPSETVTNTVNETVHGVDEATGGALGETGVTEAVEGVVEKAAGPESIVGHTVDESVEGVRETVGGLLPGSR